MLAYPGMDAKLDAYGVAQLLLLGPGRIPGSGVFRDICEVEPGFFGVFQSGKMYLQQYWKLTDREHVESFDETAEHVRYLVQDAIRRQMVSDVPIGTFLSGGLDSSLISAVCAASLSQTPLMTFSVDYQDNDKYFTASKFQPNADGEYIEIMRNFLQSQHHLTVLTADDLLNNLENATKARDLPGMADVDMSLLAFCGEIRKEVKVALSGECADEIFGGYPWYRDPEVRSLEGFPWAQNTSYRASFLHPRLRSTINPHDFVGDLYRQTLNQSDILPGTNALERRMKEMVNLNIRWFMQTLLDRKDRMSMYHGLEVRVPFCDHRIVEYLYGVPWEYKDYRGKEKGLLRAAMAGYIPKEILMRKKSPYPKTHDPRYLSLVSDLLKELLEDRDAPIFALIDRSALESLLRSEPIWPWYGQLMKLPQTITYMLQLNYWLQEYRVSVVA